MEEIGIIFLYVVGMALAVAEVFLPGAIMGLIGFVCAIASIYVAFQKDYFVLAWVLVGITVASVPLLAVLWVKVLNRVFAMKHTQKGYSGAQTELKTLVGQEGVTLTPLRPAGMARFDSEKVDVISEGDMIERDSRVKVIEVKGNRVVVRAVRQ